VAVVTISSVTVLAALEVSGNAVVCSAVLEVAIVAWEVTMVVSEDVVVNVIAAIVASVSSAAAIEASGDVVVILMVPRAAVME
jgi:hypothetical protein